MSDFIESVFGTIIVVGIFLFGIFVGIIQEEDKPCTHQIQSIQTNTVITTNWSK